MKKPFFRILLLIVSTTFFFSQTHSQQSLSTTVPPPTPTENPLWQAGKLYVKIKNSSNLDLTTYPNIANSNIASIMEYYDVTLCEKPFASLNTPVFDRTYRFTFADTSITDSLILDLEAVADIEYAEKVPMMYGQTVPDDPLLASGDQYYWSMINADGASDIYQTNPGAAGNTIVAIVDDAVLNTHQDLSANIYSNPNEIPGNGIDDDGNGYIDDTWGWDVADNDNNPNPPFSGGAATNGSRFSHGTHVAGIAGGVSDNNIGIASVGWSNTIMAVKTRSNNDNSNGLPFAFDGVVWAMNNGAQVINMSWGGAPVSQTEYNIFVTAKSMDIVLIASAGNSANNTPLYPAAYGEGLTGQTWEVVDRTLIIAVAALDQNNDRSIWSWSLFGPSGSSFGQWVDIAAYGTAIHSSISNSSNGTPINSEYGDKNGTSMAAPMVSATAGIMRSFNPSATNIDIYNCLVYSANTDIYGLGNPSNFLGTLGHGRLDAEASLQCLAVTCTDNPIAIIAQSASNICSGESMTLTANGGVSYIWSTGETTQSISVNTANTYSVTVTFPGGCTDAVSADVALFNNNLSIIINETSGFPNDGILCEQAGYSYCASASGSSYLWNGASYGQCSPNYLNGNGLLGNFSMTVSVFDMYGCPGLDGTASYTGLQVPKPPISATPTAAEICLGESITLTASGTSPFTWTWSPPTGLNTATGATVIATPTTSTNYTVSTDPDINGCRGTVIIPVFVDILTISTESYGLCNGVGIADGTVTATVIGLRPPYTYLWDDLNAQTTQTATNLAAGSYTCTVTDAIGCSIISTATIISAPTSGLQLWTINVTPGSCSSGNDGEATVTIIGGVAPFTYEWFNSLNVSLNQFSTTAIGLSAGDYIFVATDANGCQVTADVNIFNTLLTSTTNTMPGCYQGSTGTATATASSFSGTFPYDYLWSNGQTSQTATGLSAGNYTVIINDINGCTNTETVSIVDPPAMTVHTVVTNTTCSEGNGAIAWGGISGGTAPYTSSGWSNGASTFSLWNLTEGTYSITLIDANGCIFNHFVSVGDDYPYYDYPNGHTLSHNNTPFEDINGDHFIRVKGPVIVESGVNYTISDEVVEFTRDPSILIDQGIPQSGIVVKDNAKLILNNGTTLKGISGCNSMWDGVQVWGDPRSTQIIFNPQKKMLQSKLNENSLKNGKLIMDDAQIQDAHYAVRLYREPDPFIMQPLDYGRGIIEAENSRFINNYVGVAFRSRLLRNNFSSIQTSTFTCDAAMIETSTYPGEGTSRFISMDKVKNVFIRGNSFNANTTFTEEARGTGIYSFNSSYSVEALHIPGQLFNTPPIPNTFNGLTKGIDAHATGGIVTNINVTGNKFTNNTLQGITMQSTNFSNIEDNVFDVPGPTGMLNTYGVFALNSKGYIIQHNQFTGVVGTASYGVIANNTGAFGAEISSNIFSELGVATQTENVNQALAIKCNHYYNQSGGKGILVNPNTTGSLNDQGTGCGPQDLQANNSFDIPNCGTDKNHILSTVEFGYYDNYTSSDHADPNCIGKTNGTPLFGLAPCTGGLPASDCEPGVNCPPPCIIMKIGNAPDFVQKQLLTNELIREYLKTNKENKALLAVENIPNLEAQKMVISTLIGKRDIGMAETKLMMIPNNTIEDQNYIVLNEMVKDLYFDDKTLQDMDMTQKQVVEMVATTDTKTSLSAQGVLSNTKKEKYNRIPQKLNSTKMGSFNVTDEGNWISGLLIDKLGLKVYPNPFKEETTVEYTISQFESTAEIRIVDLLGKQVATYLITETGNGQVTFRATEYGNTIYFCHLIVDGKVVGVTKLVLMK